jgi:hypothetical protein
MSAALLAEIREVARELDVVHARFTALLSKANAAGATEDDCGLGLRTWLRRELRYSAREAGRQAMLAKRLPARVETAAAYASGEIGVEHAQAITRCLDQLAASAQSVAEPILVDAARVVAADDLSQVVDAAREAWGGETLAEREQRRYASRWVMTSSTLDGMVALDGMLDPESGATLTAALHALMSVQVDGDDRTTGQRRADALTDLAHRALASGQLPEIAGDRPHVSVTIDWGWLSGQVSQLPRPETDSPLAPQQQAGLLQRQRARSARPDGRPAADTPTPVALLDRRSRAVLGNGGYGGVPLSIESVRRIACDALVLPAVMRGTSELLDLGRASRTWTTHQRRAAALRDRGCVWPGCDKPLDLCQLHHLHHWADGGPSDLANSAHLCHHHHWLVHHSSWTIRRHPVTRQIEVLRT